jgi:hypothetical protein
MNPMTNKPTGFQLYLKNAGQWVRADGFFAAVKKVEGLQPFAQRQIGRLKNGHYAYRELLQALAAHLEPLALDPFWVLLILLCGHIPEDINFLPGSAVRAYRAVRPNDAPEEFESRRIIGEMGLI